MRKMGRGRIIRYVHLKLVIKNDKGEIKKKSEKILHIIIACDSQKSYMEINVLLLNLSPEGFT